MSPLVALALALTPSEPATGHHWAARHQAAVYSPDGFERPILSLATSLAIYAEAHQARYESPIGDDGVLGQDWEVMARALLGLLNGETGRLDCGTVDKAIRAMGTAAGINLDE